MASLDLEYLGQLVTRLRGYKSPTDAQKLILLLNQKPNRNEEENKNLAVLLNAEKQAERLLSARKAARDLVNKTKTLEKRKQDHLKILWAVALTSEAKANDDPMMAQVMVKLSNSKHLTDKDKELLRADLKARELRGDLVIPHDIPNQPQNKLNLNELNNQLNRSAH